MEPRVSILIPVYKAQKYIEKCLCSVFGQTYSNIEFILADDASPDDSITIAIEVAKRYRRERYLTIIKNDVNKGIAYTRNSLLNHASGDYIYFVDSDDFIEKNAIEIFVKYAVQDNADIVRCNYFKYFNGVSNAINRMPNEYNEDQLGYCLSNISGMHALWLLFIKRKFLVDYQLQFAENINCLEDYLMSVKLYYYAQRIHDTNIPLYHYRIDNNDSITHINVYFHDNAIRAVSEIDHFINEKGLSEKYRSQILKIKYLSKQSYLLSKDIRDINKFIYTFPESNSSYKYFNYNWKQKCLLYLAEHHHIKALKLACKLSIILN